MNNETFDERKFRILNECKQKSFVVEWMDEKDNQRKSAILANTSEEAKLQVEEIYRDFKQFITAYEGTFDWPEKQKKRKSSYQKLKDREKEYLSDIRALVNPKDLLSYQEVKVKWSLRFQLEDTMFMGEPIRDNTGICGVFNQIC